MLDLYQDIQEYGYLFPFRDNIPKIKNHIFSDIQNLDLKLDEYVVSKMLDIDYIGWTTKVILNIELFPIQMAILRRLWDTPFPMFIGSRGGSKTFLLAVYAILKSVFEPGAKIVIVGAGLRQAKLVFNYISTIWSSAPVLRSIVGGGKNAGPKQSVDQCYFKVGSSIITGLPVGDGCVSACTAITYDDCIGTIDRDHFKNIDNKETVKRSRNVWGNNKFNLSDESYCNGTMPTKKIRTKCQYNIEGTFNHKIKIVRNAKIVWERFDKLQKNDKALIDRSIRWHNGNTDITPEEGYCAGILAGNGCYTSKYNISYRTIDHETGRSLLALGDFKQTKSDKTRYVIYGEEKCKKILDKFGTGLCYAHEKYIPINILKSNKNVVRSFLSGVFDTDSGIRLRLDKRDSKSLECQIQYSSTSKKLIDQLHYVLLHFGIISTIHTRCKRNEKWNIEHVLIISGKNIIKFYENIGYRCIRKQNILLSAIDQKKRWMSQKDNIPDVLPIMIGLVKQYGSFNNDKISLKTLRRRRGASFDLTEIFLNMFNNVKDDKIDVIKNLFNRDVYYDQIEFIEDSECITYDVHIPETHEYCANGFYSHNTKIRGFRANIIIADEFASIQEDIFDIVIRGFAATAKTPVDEAKKLAFKKKIKNLNISSKDKDKILHGISIAKGNQIVYSGTAYYAFNHFAKKFETWRTIINSCGDNKIIADIFGGENNIPINFDYKDYTVIRVPYTHLPDGLLDPRQLANAKATLPRNIFNMEYGSCLLPDSYVDTKCGIKFIEDIEIGDEVLAHSGEWKRVTKKKYRKYNGKICSFRCDNDLPIQCTEDHLIYTNNGFIPISKLHPRNKIRISGHNLKDDYIFDMKLYCKNYLTYFENGIEYLYPRPGSYKNGKYRVGYKPKGAVPRYIPFDYNLGLILGYYAGDGDINNKFSQVQVTFNKKQSTYANQFTEAVKNIFGLNCTSYFRDNTLRVFVNSKLVCQFIDALIGRYSKNKRIYCYDQLTKNGCCGLIVGYWHADGYMNRNNYHAASISLSLISDIRRILLSLGCYCYLRYRKPKMNYFIKEKRYLKSGEQWILCIKGFGNKKNFENILNNNPVNYLDSFDLNINDYTEKEYNGTVYNLEIEDVHSYFAGGCFHHNCFVADSDGYFPRSMIESCTVGPNRPIQTLDGDVTFTPLMTGVKGRKYVIGIDPAAERDNLSIVVLEVWSNHARVVYCWSINKPEFKRRQKIYDVEADDYYDYCCNKIRQVVQRFKPMRILMDSQGGGYSISEMLRNPKLINKDKGEFPIYETIDLEDPKFLDGKSDGPHILELISQSSDYNSMSNLSLHKSLETRSLLFPAFDAVRMQLALALEKTMNITIDTFEECVNNIEEMKNELCIIKRTETLTGKERFDTPNVSSPITTEGRNIKGRLRKDRYTALLLSHHHVYTNEFVYEEAVPDYEDVAGNFKKIDKCDPLGGMYTGLGVPMMKNAEFYTKGNLVPFGAVKRREKI